MSMQVLWISSIVKIVFVLAVAVLTFAPVIIWAERRQSAMMQDRVGPSRAPITLPAALVRLLDGARGPLSVGALLVGLAAGLGVLALVVGIAWSWAAGKFALATPPAFLASPLLAQVIVGLLVLYMLLRAGHWVNTTVVNNGGKLMLLGLLHPLADAIKFMFKEDFVPPRADKLLHSLSPIIMLMPAIAAFAVIPFADVLYLEQAATVISREGVAGAATVIPMQVASLNVGVLFVLAVAGTGIVGSAIGGYASDSKFSLLGGMRAASQMVSYEVVLGLTLVPCFMVYGSLRLEEMAVWQYDHVWGVLVPTLTLAFFLYMFAAIAETKRIPFDLPEGESELAGGYLTEYSGMKFGMFFMSEFVEVVALGAIAVLVFLGGWDMPFLYRDGIDLPGTWAFTIPGLGWTVTDSLPLMHGVVVALQVLAMLLKIVVLIWFQLMVRWTLPRFRYDQVMTLCWKGLLPLALVNILATGILIQLGWLDDWVGWINLDWVATWIEQAL